jgi:hypothetical protein
MWRVRCLCGVGLSRWGFSGFLLTEAERGWDRDAPVERLPEQVVRQACHWFSLALALAVKRADHVVGESGTVEVAWHGGDGLDVDVCPFSRSAGELEQQGDRDGTDEHR